MKMSSRDNDLDGLSPEVEKILRERRRNVNNKEYQKEYKKNKYDNDPEYREKEKERAKINREKDPEYIKRYIENLDDCGKIELELAKKRYYEKIKNNPELLEIKRKKDREQKMIKRFLNDEGYRNYLRENGERYKNDESFRNKLETALKEHEENKNK